MFHHERRGILPSDKHCPGIWGSDNHQCSYISPRTRPREHFKIFDNQDQEAFCTDRWGSIEAGKWCKTSNWRPSEHHGFCWRWEGNQWTKENHANCFHDGSWNQLTTHSLYSSWSKFKTFMLRKCMLVINFEDKYVKPNISCFNSKKVNPFLHLQ